MNDKMDPKREKTENRLDNLINVVEKKERTQRHLEEYSDEMKKDVLESSRILQEIRAEEIANIKNNITGCGSHNEDDLDNLKRNYVYAENYMEHNKDHMKDEDLKNLKEKQDNRKDQLDNY